MTGIDPLRSLEVPVILPTMSATDPFSPEAHDPFYIPDRTAEVASFIVAGLGGLTVIIALVVLPLRAANLVVFVAMGLFALLLAMRGAAARKHRLARAQQVDELRANVLRESENTA